MKYPATQRWPMPPSTGSCATHRTALKGESLRKQRLPDESAHPRADLDECLAAHCNALRDVIQARLLDPSSSAMT